MLPCLVRLFVSKSFIIRETRYACKHCDSVMLLMHIATRDENKLMALQTRRVRSPSGAPSGVMRQARCAMMSFVTTGSGVFALIRNRLEVVIRRFCDSLCLSTVQGAKVGVYRLIACIGRRGAGGFIPRKANMI